jgi:molybdopterin-guanine dinucleotide biosynthesis protein B
LIGKRLSVKAVGIVGFKKSGKTTLVLGLSRELTRRGFRVAVVKHVSGNLDFPDSDTAKFKSVVPYVCAVSSSETEIILQGERNLEDILMYFDFEILLVEGFKKEKTFPKIVCLRDEREKEDLFDGLEICSASFRENISDFQIMNADHIQTMADIIVERGFKLPSLNCGHCGYESCFELAKEMVRGKASLDTCVSLDPPVSVRVDGTALPLNPFTSNLLKNTILAMLSSLKGVRKGPVRIEIP